MPHTAEGHCWPCTAPRARGRPSSPPTAASGQTRAPPAKPSAPRQPVSVPVLPRNQVRVLLNHPCHGSQMEKPKASVPGDAPRSCRPRPAPPLSNRKLLSAKRHAPGFWEGSAGAAGTKALRPVTPGPGGPAPAMGGLGRGPMSWAPEENLRPAGAEPGPPCASLGSEVGVDCPSTRAARGWGGGAALALTWHPGSAGTRGPGRPPATVWLGQAQLNPHSPGLGAGAGAGAGPGEDGCRPAQPAPEPGSPPRRQGPPERSGPGRVQGRHAASPSGLVVPGGGRTRRAQPGAPSRPLRTVLPPSRSALP